MCSALLAQLYFCSKWPTGLMNIGRDGPMVWMYNKINLYSHSKICSSMLIHHGILLCASPPPLVLKHCIHKKILSSCYLSSCYMSYWYLYYGYLSSCYMSSCYLTSCYLLHVFLLQT